MGNKGLTCCGNKNMSGEQKDELIIEESQVLKIYKVSNADNNATTSPEGNRNTKGGRNWKSKVQTQRVNYG